MEKKFELDNNWLPERARLVRIRLASGEQRILATRSSGWGRLQELARQILAPEEDDVQRNVLAALLFAGSRTNENGRVDLDSLVGNILSPSPQFKKVTDSLFLSSSSYALNERSAPWRIPLVQRIVPHLSASTTADHRPWLDMNDWCTTVSELIGFKDNSDLVGRRDLLAQAIPKSGFYRCLAPAPNSEAVVALADEFPNFAEVVEHTADQVAIAALGKGYLRLPPVLFLGDPGVGKSVFAERLAAVLGVRSHTSQLSHASQGGALGGLSSYWGTGSPGAVFNTLLRGRDMNPVFVIDEVDKASSYEGRHDPLGPLYTLLEPDTACAFIDEYVGTPVDASWFSWIATANDRTAIPAPIISRLAVFEIRQPTNSELRHIGQRQYRRMIEEYNLVEHFPAQAPAALLDQIEVSPRELRILISRAIGRMARNRVSGRPTEGGLGLSALKRERARIGFV